MVLEGDTLIWDVEIDDFDFADVDQYTVSVQTPEINYKKTLDKSKIIANMDENKEVIAQAEATPFPHASLYYMLSDVDDEYIYTIHQSDPMWKYSMEGIKGDIYRIKKDGSKSQMEKIIALSSQPESIASIAVAGKYIYYSVSLNKNLNGVDLYGFYRIPKTGGTAEFLFEEEFSFMRAYQDKIHFLFREKKNLAVLDCKTKKLDYLTLDTEKVLAEMLGAGWQNKGYLFTPFSVYQNKVYYGGYLEEDTKRDYFYVSYDLKEGTTTKLKQDVFDMVTETDEGRVLTYGLNPVFMYGETLENPDPNAYLGVTKDGLGCYKNSQIMSYAFMQLDPEKMSLQYQDVKGLEIASTMDAYSVVDNWLFFPEQAIFIKDQVIVASISPSNSSDLTSKWKIDDAYKETSH